MPSFREVLEYVRSNYRLLREESDWFCLGWTAAVPKDADDRGNQTVVVSQFSAFGEPWLCVRAEVCAEAALAPGQALRHGAGLVIGALVLEGESYVLRHTMTLAPLVLADLAQAMEYIAWESLQLRLHTLGLTLPDSPAETPADPSTTPPPVTAEAPTPAGPKNPFNLWDS